MIHHNYSSVKEGSLSASKLPLWKLDFSFQGYVAYSKLSVCFWNIRYELGSKLILNILTFNFKLTLNPNSFVTIPIGNDELFIPFYPDLDLFSHEIIVWVNISALFKKKTFPLCCQHHWKNCSIINTEQFKMNVIPSFSNSSHNKMYSPRTQVMCKLAARRFNHTSENVNLLKDSTRSENQTIREHST